MKTTSSRLRHCARAVFLALAMLAVPVASGAAVYVSVAIAPPPLPVYAQPICPGPGYIWIPGYWAYGPAGYYWVAGEWVLPPFVGALWTPGYWGWDNGLYVWNAGYWGPRVGFYGGINYGFGYTGYGYGGGYWRGNTFYYNAAVNNINASIVHTTYRTGVNSVTTSRVSYNGGAGGIVARPTAAQLADAKRPHTAATTTQVRREQTVANHRAAESTNRERAAIATTPRRAQQRASSGQAAARAQATPLHSAPIHAERRQTAPARNGPTHAARTQAAPERNTPNHVARTQAAPAQNLPTRAERTAHAAPMRSRGEPPHAEARMYADAARVQAPGAPQERPRAKPQGDKGGGDERHGK